MKVRFQVQELIAALDTASIVPPRPLGTDTVAGFLFVVRDGQCSIYSREQRHQIRVTVPIETPDASGSFIFPADRVSALKYLDGWIEIEAGLDEAADRHWVRYEAESKDKQEDLSTIDPRMMQPLDEALNSATEGAEFPAAILREAINTVKPYLAKAGDARVEEHFQSLQLFDASNEKGDGHMFAADGVRSCMFFTTKLQGKGLSLHGHNLPFLGAFLGKCQGNVNLRHGKGVTFLVNSQGHVLSWAHNVHAHAKFSYYALKSDHFVLRADRDLFVKALKYVRAALEAKREKVRLQYTHTDRTLLILTSEGTAKAASRPVIVEPVEEESGAGAKGAVESFAVNVNLNHLLDLLEPMKAHRIELRAAPVPAAPNRKESMFFRTIDTFVIDSDGRPLISSKDSNEGEAAECQVTRFMPSRE